MDRWCRGLLTELRPLPPRPWGDVGEPWFRAAANGLCRRFDVVVGAPELDVDSAGPDTTVLSVVLAPNEWVSDSVLAMRGGFCDFSLWFRPEEEARSWFQHTAAPAVRPQRLGLAAAGL